MEATDVVAEHARLTAIGGVDVDAELTRVTGAPLMFMLRDPDGNDIVVVEAPPATTHLLRLLALPLSVVGGGIAAGAYWLVVGWMLRHERLERRQGPAVATA